MSIVNLVKQKLKFFQKFSIITISLIKATMIFSKSIQRYCCRHIFTTRVNQISSLVKLKKLQADFQAEDGKPIWLKGGPKDRILSSATFFLCYVGILMTLTTIYDNAKPSSWKSKTC